MLSFHCADSGQLLTAATALSVALAQGKSQNELSRLAAFFTLVGDTLALLALQLESSSDCGQHQDVTSPDMP